MRNHHHVVLVLFLAPVFLMAGHGRVLAITESGAPLLGFPIHARIVGMGETGVADNSDPSTVYYNPANAVAPPRAYLTGSRLNWPEEWFVSDLWAGRANAGFSWQGSRSSPLTWGVDFTMATLDYGESITTAPNGTPLGTVHAFERVASLALAVGIPSGDTVEFRAGVAAKRWWARYGSEEFAESHYDVEPDAYAFDAGVTAVMRTMAGGWRVDPALAVAIVDVGPDIDYGEGEDPLPLRLNFGVTIRAESPPYRLGNADVPIVAVTANVDGTEPHNGDFQWGIGTEIAIAQILFLRTGTHLLHQDDSDDLRSSAWGVGLGVPIDSFRLRVDYTKGDFYYSTTTDYIGVMLAWVF